MPLPALVLDPGPYRDVPVAPPSFRVLFAAVLGAILGLLLALLSSKADGGRIGGRIAHADSSKDGPGRSLLVAGERPVRPVYPSLHGTGERPAGCAKKPAGVFSGGLSIVLAAMALSRDGLSPCSPGSGEGVKSPFSFPPSCKPRQSGKTGKGRGDVLPLPQPSSPFSFSCSRAALEAPDAGQAAQIVHAGGPHGLQTAEGLPEQACRGRADAGQAHELAGKGGLTARLAVTADGETVRGVTHVLQKEQLRAAFTQGQGLLRPGRKMRSATLPARRSAWPASSRALAMAASGKKSALPASARARSTTASWPRPVDEHQVGPGRAAFQTPGHPGIERAVIVAAVGHGIGPVLVGAGAAVLIDNHAHAGLAAAGMGHVHAFDAPGRARQVQSPRQPFRQGRFLQLFAPPGLFAGIGLGHVHQTVVGRVLRRHQPHRAAAPFGKGLFQQAALVGAPSVPPSSPSASCTAAGSQGSRMRGGGVSCS